MEPIINYNSWEQLRLLPPSALRIEIVVYLDGVAGTATVGWKVSETDTDNLVEIGVSHPEPLSDTQMLSVTILNNLVGTATAIVSPF